jgi:hypothetical protein
MPYPTTQASKVPLNLPDAMRFYLHLAAAQLRRLIH